MFHQQSDDQLLKVHGSMTSSTLRNSKVGKGFERHYEKTKPNQNNTSLHKINQNIFTFLRGTQWKTYIKPFKTYGKTQAQDVLRASDLRWCQSLQAGSSVWWPSSRANTWHQTIMKEPTLRLQVLFQKSSQPVSGVLFFDLLGHCPWQTYVLCFWNEKVSVILPKGGSLF